MHSTCHANGSGDKRVWVKPDPHGYGCYRFSQPWKQYLKIGILAKEIKVPNSTGTIHNDREQEPDAKIANADDSIYNRKKQNTTRKYQKLRQKFP